MVRLQPELSGRIVQSVRNRGRQFSAGVPVVIRRRSFGHVGSGRPRGRRGDQCRVPLTKAKNVTGLEISIVVADFERLVATGHGVELVRECFKIVRFHVRTQSANGIRRTGRR